MAAIIWLAGKLVVSPLVKELAAYKTNNFYYQHLFSARFFLHIFVCRILFSKLNQIPNQISNQNISKIQGNCDKQTITSWEILIF